MGKRSWTLRAPGAVEEWEDLHILYFDEILICITLIDLGLRVEMN